MKTSLKPVSGFTGCHFCISLGVCCGAGARAGVVERVQEVERGAGVTARVLVVSGVRAKTGARKHRHSLHCTRMTSQKNLNVWPRKVYILL